jgi:hypothetical protein
MMPRKMADTVVVELAEDSGEIAGDGEEGLLGDGVEEVWGPPVR